MVPLHNEKEQSYVRNLYQDPHHFQDGGGRVTIFGSSTSRQQIG